jgi:chemotaxis signal transduction protein
MPPVAAAEGGSTDGASGAAGALVGASIDGEATTPAPPDEDAEIRRPDGYVVFAVGDACFAVPVDEVRAVIRTERLDLLPGGERPRYGRGVALVDVRGRAIPVVDLRSDPSVAGEVLLPLYRHHVGLVVDRVVSVSSSRELVPEPDGLPDVLPAYAHGVLRPAEGGPAVLLVGLPDAEFLQG